MARDRNLDRKLKTLSGSRFFWVYSLSLWEPDAFWNCVLGASLFALIGLVTVVASTREFRPVEVTSIFEFFILGLILMWTYKLGPWFRPTNLIVIFTFIFRLYRKNKTLDDLSAEDISRMFPHESTFLGGPVRLTRVLTGIRGSPVLGSLLVGICFAGLLIALLVISS